MENGNQAAFPCVDTICPDGTRTEPLNVGLTKREHFAAMAMQGFLSGNEINRTGRKTASSIVEMSIILADELLKQLEK